MLARLSPHGALASCVVPLVFVHPCTRCIASTCVGHCRARNPRGTRQTVRESLPRLHPPGSGARIWPSMADNGGFSCCSNPGAPELANLVRATLRSPQILLGQTGCGRELSQSFPLNSRRRKDSRERLICCQSPPNDPESGVCSPIPVRWCRCPASARAIIASQPAVVAARHRNSVVRWLV